MSFSKDMAFDKEVNTILFDHTYFQVNSEYSNEN